MVEVFRTNIGSEKQAQIVLAAIGKRFPQYQINFDIDDCDHIMRVTINEGEVDAKSLCSTIGKLGFSAEVLPDEVPQLLLFEEGE